MSNDKNIKPTIEDYIKDPNAWFNQIQTLIKERAKFKKALAFYANKSFFSDHDCCMVSDPTKTAREALEESGE